MKIDRLISILVVLLRRERVQAKELAEMFGVSVRTILRDVEAINLAGIPIVTYQGANGGIAVAEGYRIDKSILSADELAAIMASLKGVSATIPDQRYEILMEKLKNPLSSDQLSVLDQKSRQMIIDLSPWGGYGDLKEILIMLRGAIEKHLVIAFEYTDADSRKSKRRAEPYSLLLKGQQWYLYAWCLLRQDFRIFKLSRIRDLSVCGPGFDPREIPDETFPWEDEWQKNAGMLELDLLFEAEMESLVEEHFDAPMYKQEDGRILVKISLPENNWMYGWLLSFGSMMEVLHPPHVRRILADMAGKILARYADEPDT